MTDEQYEKEVDDLAGMLLSLRLIKDKERRKWLKKEIIIQVKTLIAD